MTWDIVIAAIIIITVIIVVIRFIVVDVPKIIAIFQPRNPVEVVHVLINLIFFGVGAAYFFAVFNGYSLQKAMGIAGIAYVASRVVNFVFAKINKREETIYYEPDDPEKQKQADPGDRFWNY